MTSEIKTRLKQLEDRLRPIWEEGPPPDALSVSLWEWGAFLASLTDEERKEAAAELGISLEALAEIEKQCCKAPRWREATHD